jgi:hypothetical protein
MSLYDNQSVVPSIKIKGGCLESALAYSRVKHNA